MFKWKKRSEYQDEIIASQAEKIIMLSNKADEYKIVTDNFKNLENEKTIGLDLYIHNGNVYYTYADNIYKNCLDCAFECDIFTYRINGFIDYNGWITRSQLELYHRNEAYSLELVNIDTQRETRQGHASRQIQKIIYVSKLLNISKIYGMLFDQTYIGIENLKRFYIKNGFEVGKSGFHMNL
jgi:hypothetical protein